MFCYETHIVYNLEGEEGSAPDEWDGPLDERSEEEKKEKDDTPSRIPGVS